MRSVRIATCTSGEPVSPLPCACSLISACLRSAVIDIVSLLFFSKVESPDDPKAIGRSFHECDGTFVLGRECKPRLGGETGQALSMSEQLCLAGGDGEGRDVVQRRFERQYHPRQLARLSGFGEKVQRNGFFEAERTGARTS